MWQHILILRKKNDQKYILKTNSKESIMNLKLIRAETSMGGNDHTWQFQITHTQFNHQTE